MKKQNGLMNFEVWMKHNANGSSVATVEVSNKFEELGEKVECEPCGKELEQSSPFTGPVSILQCC